MFLTITHFDDSLTVAVWEVLGRIQTKISRCNDARIIILSCELRLDSSQFPVVGSNNSSRETFSIATHVQSISTPPAGAHFWKHYFVLGTKKWKLRAVWPTLIMFVHISFLGLYDGMFHTDVMCLLENMKNFHYKYCSRLFLQYNFIYC